MFEKYRQLRTQVVATAILLLLYNIAFLSSALASESSINKLRKNQWREIKKVDEVKKLEGQGRYKNLTRVIHISHFVFEKAGKRKVCWISYDSQQDKIRENCKPLE